jgi:hypothetical protein
MTYEAFVRFNEEQGYHWFKPDTMRFFDSKIHDWDVKTGFFISSEKGPIRGSVRKFTVRKADFETGNVSTLSEFQEFDSIDEARIFIDYELEEET